MFKKRRRANTQRRRNVGQKSQEVEEDGRIQLGGVTKARERARNDRRHETEVKDTPANEPDEKHIISNGKKEGSGFEREVEDGDMNVVQGKDIKLKLPKWIYGKDVNAIEDGFSKGEVADEGESKGEYSKERLEEMRIQYLPPSKSGASDGRGVEDEDLRENEKRNRSEVEAWDRKVDASIFLDRKTEEVPLEYESKEVDVEGEVVEEMDSEDDEWEIEQLKRAGILAGPQMRESIPNHDISGTLLDSLRLGGDADNAAPAKVRNQIFEHMSQEAPGEDGEDGEQDPFKLHDMMDCVSQSVSKCEVELSDLQRDAQDLQEEEERAVSAQKDRELRRADARALVEFYLDFKSYIDDLSDMLNEKQAIVDQIREEKTERLKNLAETRMSDEDAFGRQKRIEVRGDGYESDDSLSESGSDVVMDEDDECIDGSAEKSAPDIFEDVADEYLSAECILKRFLEWKKRYPKDYSSAHGDLSAGKLIGALNGLLFDTDDDRPSKDDFAFFAGLPEAARCPAFIASNSGKISALQLRANWTPASDKSTSKYLLLFHEMRSCFEGVGDRYKTRVAKCWEDLGVCVSEVLRSEIHGLKTLSHGTPLAFVRRASKMCRNAMRMQNLIGRVKDFESMIIQDVFQDIILANLESLPKAERAPMLIRAAQASLSEHKESAKVRNALQVAVRNQFDIWGIEFQDSEQALKPIG
eukprot:Plantae.Rhodophyta-Hildenbrandia_rubra.ctg9728.p1 GENE.Plantae.Rhodophyta-Hildenbrandia_rubra.ctg9728~~Plantae.Rhodophyta-Hildenbrandia_rubra.ctg9728.p1  ORF type:complete len:698 (+),score=150.09 Plantae.Rhodophyta-Hildenbrandia_rubra.ctg9728:1569-3662(+)